MKPFLLMLHLFIVYSSITQAQRLSYLVTIKGRTEASRKRFEELIADKPELRKKFQEEKRISFEELRACYPL